MTQFGLTFGFRAPLRLLENVQRPTHAADRQSHSGIEQKMLRCIEGGGFKGSLDVDGGQCMGRALFTYLEDKASWSFETWNLRLTFSSSRVLLDEAVDFDFGVMAPPRLR